MADNTIAKNITKWSLVLGVLMALAGMLAIALPLVAGFAINLVVAWLLVFCGVVHLVFGVHRRSAGGVFWQILLFMIYAGIGVYLLFRPLVGLEALTLALAMFLLIEAAFEIGLYIEFRKLPGAGWLLFGGIVTFALSVMIWASWPSSSAWAIGTLIGISMLFSGLARIMLTIASRELTTRVS